jgi:hypothetical protein
LTFFCAKRPLLLFSLELFHFFINISQHRRLFSLALFNTATMGRMEDLLMGGDSSGSDESDAETKNKGAGAATHAAVPSIVTAAGPSSSSPPKPPLAGRSDSKSELTNRLKNLYTAPPIPAPPPPAPVQIPPPPDGGQQGNNIEVASVGAVGAAMAASSPLSRQSSLNNPSNNFIPPMVPTSHRNSPASAQQPQQQQQQHQQHQQQQQQQQHQYTGAMTPTAQHGSVGRVPAPLPKAR